ncbi:MAG: hypothetical protein ACI8W9_001076 [Psychromonas sp.]|jgi:hypothetical protein
MSFFSENIFFKKNSIGKWSGIYFICNKKEKAKITEHFSKVNEQTSDTPSESN